MDSSYKNLEFKFIKCSGIIVENGGKKATGNQFGSYVVFCESSIPLNQNVKLAFRMISLPLMGDVELGICSKDQSGNLNNKNRYMINKYSIQFIERDIVLLDIRMKDKKIIFKNLRSSEQQQMSIDTSQVLYPCALLYMSCIQIVDEKDYLNNYQELIQSLINRYLNPPSTIAYAGYTLLFNNVIPQTIIFHFYKLFFKLNEYYLKLQIPSHGYIMRFIIQKTQHKKYDSKAQNFLLFNQQNLISYMSQGYIMLISYIKKYFEGKWCQKQN
ncbi:unnamed protein product [Paramecium sonneborni]|uniref:Uncharacterized protein n=1 Tax=Paramecium sonneborni TaxID=65129 RepID=A0A8S1R5X7_9CILI|nr:unnamed protein product [Paramecium sonneborni]